MTVRTDWNVEFTEPGNPSVTTYGVEWRLMSDGSVFLHARKNTDTKWLVFKNFDKLRSISEDVEDTLRAALNEATIAQQ